MDLNRNVTTQPKKRMSINDDGEVSFYKGVQVTTTLMSRSIRSEDINAFSATLIELNTDNVVDLSVNIGDLVSNSIETHNLTTDQISTTLNNSKHHTQNF